MDLKSIAILTCWYGPFPWYFPYFVHSCRFNPTIDFIIITDNKELIPNKPDNIIIVDRSLTDVRNIASEKLGFKVNIDYPYKLCDFKPAYAFIFSEIVKNYDFWGIGDIDILYGNIRNFMTEELLISHDVISSRHDYVTGTFSLFRNTKQINTLFMQSRDYRKVFSSNIHFCFDECNFLFKELKNGASILDFPDNIQSMTYLVKKNEIEGKLRVFFDFIIVEGMPGKIKWENGQVIYKNKYEAMYYNLLRFKREGRKPNNIYPIANTIYFNTKTIRYKRTQK